MSELKKKVTYAAIAGAIIAEERVRNETSQQVVASIAKVTQSTWARIETGRACTLENIVKASMAIGLEPWQLLKVVDDRVKGLLSQGYEVVVDVPSESEVKADPDSWLTARNIITAVSIAAIAAPLIPAALNGVSEYLSSLWKKGE